MEPRIRAKFRCLNITQKLNNVFDVDLRPVHQNGKTSPENEAFWKSTPNGECVLTFTGTPPIEFGAYYFIDLEREEGAAWTFETLTLSHGGGGSVAFSFYRPWEKRAEPGLSSGQLKMGLSSEAARTLGLFGHPDGVKWRVVTAFAEGSDS